MNCEHCNIKQAKPSRSRMPGVCATTFGDLLLLGHTEVKLHGATYDVLLNVDAASSLLAAYCQMSLDAAETLGKFREGLETYQRTPKVVCVDMTCDTKLSADLCCHHCIRPLSTGTGTPWLNRAEAAVRLFKL